MTNLTNNNQFRDDEIVIMSHWDKKEEKWVKSIFTKVGGRLRLSYEDNENMYITTEIVRYDESIAVVRAVTTTSKGSFPGIGMAVLKGIIPPHRRSSNWQRRESSQGLSALPDTASNTAAQRRFPTWRTEMGIPVTRQPR